MAHRFSCFLRKELFLFCLLLKSSSPVSTRFKKIVSLTFFIFQTEFQNAFSSQIFLTVRMKVKEESYFLSAGIGFHMFFVQYWAVPLFVGKQIFLKIG